MSHNTFLLPVNYLHPSFIVCSVTMKGKQVTALARREFLRRESEAIQVLCEDKIRATTGEVEKRLASAIKNTVSLLPQFIKDFKAVFPKDPETLPTYLQKLYEFIDQEFSQSVLDHVTASSLATFHEEAKNDIIGEWPQFISSMKAFVVIIIF